MNPGHVIVTGGTGGLGGAVASEFASHGWRVEAPGSADLDMRDPEVIRSYLAGREPDLLVCAAGVARDSLLAKATIADWDESWTVNFNGAVRCAESVIPGMVRRGSGHVVFISSWSALHPPVGQAAYAATKAALLGLTRDLAGRFGSCNIRVNAVLPGFLETRMTAGLTPSRKREIIGDHSLGRFNTADRVAAFLRFLHENLPHTSGQIFQLDSRMG